MKISKREKIFVVVTIGILITSVSLLIILKGLDSKPNDSPSKRDFPGMREDRVDDLEGRVQMPEMNEEEVFAVEAFFNSSPLDSEIESYCAENINHCMYYCIRNFENQYCENLVSEYFYQKFEKLEGLNE